MDDEERRQQRQWWEKLGLTHAVDAMDRSRAGLAEDREDGATDDESAAIDETLQLWYRLGLSHVTRRQARQHVISQRKAEKDDDLWIPKI